MTIAIMQPYIFPYIGYFQLMANVDQFVIYDNIQYTKKGWINRNRILQNGKDFQFSIPLKKDSDYLNISDRALSDSWEFDKKKLLNKLNELYKKAPYFIEVIAIVEKCINYTDSNLFSFLYNALRIVNDYLEIKTPIVISSTLAIDHSLKGEHKVLAICAACNATNYINAIGGKDLYNKETFSVHNINLHFIKTNNIVYKQFDNTFIPFLSIIDVMMFNVKEEVQDIVNNKFTLV